MKNKRSEKVEEGSGEVGKRLGRKKKGLSCKLHRQFGHGRNCWKRHIRRKMTLKGVENIFKGLKRLYRHSSA